jgi:hypothetical protein
MMIYQEKITAPADRSNQENPTLFAEARASDDRWIKKFIAGLAGKLRGKFKRRLG